ncbi:MarR family transcriptional regulator [Nocardia tengchongensis]|uniref:MarR family transcriptional regulator n=1 Tax=Nocardia tengchongensis TaxID=2055889 RepID=A0ABX8CW55_9NOCA|nr:MarR family transcriptional regulator [Nocardia tengchongensis]QVI22740.1 MarR family transcriptional regulator [Nocardia tengchongensis]
MAAGRNGREPRWLTPEQQRAWRAYTDGSQRLMTELNRQLQRDCDLSFADYRILVKLSEAPGRALRMSDLADGVLSSRSRLTHQIRRMEAQRLVRRSACEDDGRGVLAQLTDEGLRRLRAAAPGHVAAVRRFFVDLLTPEQLAAVAAALDLVNQAADHRAETRPAADPE